MMTIYKYPFAFAGTVEIPLPEKAQILHIGIQNGVYCVWAIVDTSNKSLTQTALRRFRIIGTGHPLPTGLNKGNHVCTILDGGLVRYIFEVEE